MQLDPEDPWEGLRQDVRESLISYGIIAAFILVGLFCMFGIPYMTN